MYKSLTYYPEQKILVNIQYKNGTLETATYRVKKEFDYEEKLNEAKKQSRGHFYIHGFLTIMEINGYIEKINSRKLPI